MRNILLMSIVFVSAGFLASPVFAFSAQDFNKKSFESAQKEGKAIMVDVYASWCPTCKAQHKDLEAIFKEDQFKDVVSFKLDFDNKDLVRSFEKLIDKRIPRQSTIVFFKGDKIVGFSVAERSDKLQAHLEKALTTAE